jgi:hypothetical protein
MSTTDTPEIGATPSDVKVEEPSVGLEPAPAADGGELQDQSPEIEVPQTVIMLLIVAAASVVTFIAAAHWCDTLPEGTSCSDDDKSEDAFAVASGVISLVVVVLRLVLSYFNVFPDQPPARCSPAIFIAACLWLWWLCTVGAGTFKGPFKTIQNGYIAEWVGFFAISYYLVLTCQPLYGIFIKSLVTAEQSSHEQRYAALMAIWSFIFWLAAVVVCTDDENNTDCGDEYGYTIFVGVVSMIVFLAYVPLHSRMKQCGCSKWFGYVAVVYWGAATGVTTFDKPYAPPGHGSSTNAVTGNGFFSAWAAFFTCIMFAMEAGTHPWPKAAAAADVPEPTEPTPSVPTPDAEVAPEVPVEPQVETETA